MNQREIDEFFHSEHGPALRGFLQIAGEHAAKSEQEAANLLATLSEHGAPPLMEAYRLALLVQALVDAEVKTTRVPRDQVLTLLNALLAATEPSWMGVTSRAEAPAS